jgi:hypothetical protein
VLVCDDYGPSPRPTLIGGTRRKTVDLQKWTPPTPSERRAVNLHGGV